MNWIKMVNVNLYKRITFPYVFIKRQINVLNSIRSYNTVNCSNITKYEKLNSLKGVLSYPVIFAFSLTGILRFFGLAEEEEESEIVKLVRRGEILTQKEESNKAEQMFHIALKVAHEFQDEEAITHIYSRLANIALSTSQNEKAITLFTSVLSRLLEKGHEKDDLPIVHITLKMAEAYEVLKNYTMAESAYKHCFTSLEPKINEALVSRDEDTLLLWALVNDKYGKYYYNRSNYDEALQHLKLSYEIASINEEDWLEQNFIILSDLSATYYSKGDMQEALKYAKKAVQLGNLVPELFKCSSIFITIGYIYLRLGLIDQANKYCQRALKLGEESNIEDFKQYADSCLQDIKKEADLKPQAQIN